ncbi:putative collagen-binding domain-containing protein [Arcticibacter sp.]|uniref:putative collagen-binding domain-containing protein n=1 Tax=Arcticibacter sp. TaxID=1872630 RepID=UPI0038909A82
MASHKWYEWHPNGDVILGAGQGESLKTAVTTKSGDMALVYFSDNSDGRVKNVLNKDAKAYWFYPRNGKKEEVPSFKENELKTLMPPLNWEDAILVLH